MATPPGTATKRTRLQRPVVLVLYPEAPDLVASRRALAAWRPLIRRAIVYVHDHPAAHGWLAEAQADFSELDLQPAYSISCWMNRQAGRWPQQLARGEAWAAYLAGIVSTYGFAGRAVVDCEEGEGYPIDAYLRHGTPLPVSLAAIEAALREAVGGLLNPPAIDLYYAMGARPANVGAVDAAAAAAAQEWAKLWQRVFGRRLRLIDLCSLRAPSDLQVGSPGWIVRQWLQPWALRPPICQIYGALTASGPFPWTPATLGLAAASTPAEELYVWIRPEECEAFGRQAALLYEPVEPAPRKAPPPRAAPYAGGVPAEQGGMERASDNPPYSGLAR